MNITESNHVTVLVRALQGYPDVDPDAVCEAALALKARIQPVLGVSPTVNEGLITANVVTLQVMTGGLAVDTPNGELEAQIAEHLAKGEVTKVGDSDLETVDA